MESKRFLFFFCRGSFVVLMNHAPKVWQINVAHQKKQIQLSDVKIVKDVILNIWDLKT